MVGRYKVVTLCGSTKFKDDFMRVQKELTLQGCIVISVGLFGHSGDDEVWNKGTKQMLDDMHKRKIDMADEIYVINKNGYIGSSTKSEIEYAKSKGIPIIYMETNNEKEIVGKEIAGKILCVSMIVLINKSKRILSISNFTDQENSFLSIERDEERFPRYKIDVHIESDKYNVEVL